MQVGGVWACALGLCLGSFLNVLVYRLPREQSIVRPRSRCPGCKKPIAAYDNIPVLSFLLLGGRCRHCRRRISWRYPAVESFTAMMSYMIWRRWEGQPWWAMAAIVAAAGFFAVALIDWDTFLIPDELSLGLSGLGLVFSPMNPMLRPISDSYPWWLPILYSLRGAAIGFGVCWAVAEIGERLFKKEAMGGGDVKLLAAIGAWFGGTGAFDSLMIGSFFGAIYGLALIGSGKLKRSDPIPFGPFLSAGAVFNFFVLLPLGFPFITR